MFGTKFINKPNAPILCSVTCFRISCRLWDDVEK